MGVSRFGLPSPDSSFAISVWVKPISYVISAKQRHSAGSSSGAFRPMVGNIPGDLRPPTVEPVKTKAVVPGPEVLTF